ncbi:MAG: amidohydrolase family protein [Bacteroidota bacterium]
MKKIDVHSHVGRLQHAYPEITVPGLLRFMDEREIEKACVMAIENPEELDYYLTSNEVLAICKQHPDRLIPFCNVDPRRGNPGEFDPYPILAAYKEQGAKGLGEMLAGLWIDDPLQMDIYEICQELELPVMLHIDKYRNMDDLGLPRLEKILQTFPKASFIGHANHFWSEISADMKDENRFDYPKGPVKPGGRMDELLQQYDNLFADLSAGSGYNALTRDREFIREFLTRNQNQVLYGTDWLHEGQASRHHVALESSGVSEEVLEKICYTNAEGLL